MALAIARAWRLLRQEAPVAVLGLGGWPSAPTCIAATLCGVPLHLLMTDAVPGLVVRKLARRASRIHVANAAAASALAMPEKTSIVGPIVRREVVQARRDPARFGLVEGRRTLFVTGGSLGAKGLNDRVREGLRTAISADPDLARTVQVIHSTGTEEEAASSLAAFATLGLRHFVAPFIPDVGTALRTADLVLCRGGAGTLAEVEALHRPAVVVPYPHHADRQQWKNTERLLTSGLATLVEESALDTDAFANFVLGRLLADSEPPGSRDFGAAAVPKSQDGDSSVAAATIASDLVRSNGMV
jgi:UDP-N-acetylglucosamine--N-acetylmuramyl-(pentapeptide) pyrophosphoryl-undecaprenol N-acetylglucosamine transferase